MSKNIFIVAGEASGDKLGSALMRELKEISDEISFEGIGGNDMAAEGLRSLFPITDLSVMGIMEVLPRLPKLIRRINQTANAIIQSKPDIVITIDSPDFCHRVTEKVRKAGLDDIKVIHYVAPTVWAWRPERVYKLEVLYDAVLCLYPCEPEYFKNLDIKAHFVGHPLVAATPQNTGKKDSQIAVYFGSRIGEINRMGPIYRDVLLKLHSEGLGFNVVAPTLPHLKSAVKNMLEEVPFETAVVTGADQKQKALEESRMALATSGTMGLELGIAGLAHVICYKVNFVTAAIVKRKLTVSYAHMVNILFDKRIIPEFIQSECKADAIAAELKNLWAGKGLDQKENLNNLHELLLPEKNNSPAMEAANFISENYF